MSSTSLPQRISCKCEVNIAESSNIISAEVSEKLREYGMHNTKGRKKYRTEHKSLIETAEKAEWAQMFVDVCFLHGKINQVPPTAFISKLNMRECRALKICR